MSPHRMLRPALVVVCTTVVAVCAVVGVLEWRDSRSVEAANWLAKSEPEVLERAVRELVEAGAGIWDSHSDPDVGRILQPGLAGRPFGNVDVSTNEHGLRERTYELPKPPGVVRVVLLGDSFVFGAGVAADQRLGVHLERELAQRSARNARVEVLHVGVESWNVLAECSYVRRQLDLLAPDLIVQVTVFNDLSDCAGVRGFGSRARFSPQVRDRADARIADLHPYSLGVQRPNLLSMGLDHESRARYRAAGLEIQHLARAVEAAGGRYLLLVHWGPANPIVQRRWEPFLRREQVIFLPTSFLLDSRYRIAPTDEHWNPEGHERVALLLYGWIEEKGLVPSLALRSWEEARAVVRDLALPGGEEAMAALDLDRILGANPPASEVVFHPMTARTAVQIHGGVDREGRVSPYASFVLARGSGSTLSIAGSALERPELDGRKVTVSVEETVVGTMELRAGEPIREHWPLPAACRERDYLTVTLESEDYVYAPEDLQHCIVFRLESAAIR